MVLPDNVVKVFNLVCIERPIEAGVDSINGRLVGPALVDRDLVQIVVCSNGRVEEALRRSHVSLGRQQEVDGLALRVDGAIEVFPDALDLDLGLIHAPATANRALVLRAIVSMSEENESSTD